MPRSLDAIDNVLDEHDAALAQAAPRCLMVALDHSRATKIRLVTDGKNMPSVELPPKALRMVADMLGMTAQRQPVVLLSQKMELSTQDAAAFLNVSRPFVVKQIDEGRLPCRTLHGDSRCLRAVPRHPARPAAEPGARRPVPRALERSHPGRVGAQPAQATT